MDECSEKSTNNCDINAKCNNTEGSYSCQCNSDFIGDGENCTGVKYLFNFCMLKRLSGQPLSDKFAPLGTHM